MITLISFITLIVLTSLAFGFYFFVMLKMNSSLKYACLSKSFSDKNLNLLNIKDKCIITCFNFYLGFIIFIIYSTIKMSNIEDALKNNTQPDYRDIIYVSIVLALAFIMLLGITIFILYSNWKQNKKINNIKIDSSYLNELILYVKNIKIYSNENNQFLNYYTNKINKIVSKIQNSKDKVNLNFLKLIKAIIYITHNSNFYSVNYYCGSTVIDRKELINILNEKIDKCILN